MKRQHGGVSRSIDYVRVCLLQKRRNSLERDAALLQVADLVRVIAGQALHGNPDCGYFLGELLPTLRKSQATIARTNETFRRRCAEMQSAHFATAKDSPLRTMIERIIRETQAKQREQQILQHIPEASIVRALNKTLLTLPEFSDTEEAITAWMDIVVYPGVRRKHRELRGYFEMGKLQKARDENGKFQISRLKSLIRQTVARIAKLPRVYYFRVA